MDAKICQRRAKDGVIQYLVETGSGANWINSDQLSSPAMAKKIEVFMTKVYGFELGLQVERIICAVNHPTLEFGYGHGFYVQWEGTQERGYVCSRDANKFCPQLVIKFYQSRVTWNDKKEVAVKLRVWALNLKGKDTTASSSRKVADDIISDIISDIIEDSEDKGSTAPSSVNLLAADMDSDDMLPLLNDSDDINDSNDIDDIDDNEEEDSGELAADIISDIISDIFFVLTLDTSEEA